MTHDCRRVAHTPSPSLATTSATQAHRRWTSSLDFARAAHVLSVLVCSPAISCLGRPHATTSCVCNSCHFAISATRLHNGFNSLSAAVGPCAASWRRHPTRFKVRARPTQPHGGATPHICAKARMTERKQRARNAPCKLECNSRTLREEDGRGER